MSEFVPWHKRSTENAARHRENKRKSRANFVAREPEKVYEQRERSRKKHWDKHMAYLREWQKQWYETNKKELMPKRIARARAREKGMDTPLSRMFLPQTEVFYREARRLTEETGVNYVVDHYWPINGRTSCGLHVPWNLRVITSTENSAKSDKEPEDHWSSITIEQGD